MTATCFLMCVHNCGAKLYSKKGGEAPPPTHMHKILIIMIYYIWSLAVHSAVLSYVLISTVSCSPLCHALTCTRTYSPLRSTLPCSHMYSYIQSLAVHSAIPWGPLCRALLCTQIVQTAEYLCNPPVAWLVIIIIITIWRRLLEWHISAGWLDTHNNMNIIEYV